MGKPLSRPGCFRRSSCCLEKHRAGDGGLGGQEGGVEGGYGDGYVPQRSIYDTMCINQQIDNHHHSGGSIRRDFGEGSCGYPGSGSLRVGRPPPDIFDPQPRSLTPNPSFVRRLDERAIYDSLKLAGQDVDGVGCHSPGHYNRSVSPAVSSFSAPGISSSSSKKYHHHHHHHGDSTKSRDGRQSWKVLTPPKHLECVDLTTSELIDRGGVYLNPGHYIMPGGQSSSIASPLISPFSGSPLSSGYHTPVFFSPAKPRPSQTQSLRCSPPHVIQQRHYSQTQSLRLSPPQELRHSPYRSPLVQLSVNDLEQDLRERGGGWVRNEREREWERERERELERGWAQREWERERERGRLERERARERERMDTSGLGTFGYGRGVPMRSERDSVFLDPDQGLDTTPLLLPQPSPSPSPSGAPRMGTGAVGRNRAGSKVGPENISGGMISKYDNGNMVFIDNKSGCVSRVVSDIGGGNMSEAEVRAGMHQNHRADSWTKHDNVSRTSIKNMPERRMGSQVKTRPGGRDMEGKVQSGVEMKDVFENRDGHKGSTKSGERNTRCVSKHESLAEALPLNDDNRVGSGQTVGTQSLSLVGMKTDHGTQMDPKLNSPQVDNKTQTEVEVAPKAKTDLCPSTEPPRVEVKSEKDVETVSKPEADLQTKTESEIENKTISESVIDAKKSNNAHDCAQICISAIEKAGIATEDQVEEIPLDANKIQSGNVEKSSRSKKSKSSKSSSRNRPGTATGLRSGVLSPRPIRGLRDLELTNPAEGIESTWPRRVMVRKRTVRQGGALHNLPILPPLPSVLSALEKRYGPLPTRSGHISENPITSAINVTSIIGRCSFKEPSHADIIQNISSVGRASLKEQNLEHWRVSREQEEYRRSRSKEKQAEENRETQEKVEIKEKEEKTKESGETKKEEKSIKEKKKIIVDVGLVKTSPGGNLERKVKDEVIEGGCIDREKKEVEEVEVIDVRINVAMQEHHGYGLQEVAVELHRAEDEEEEDEVADERGVEGWDSVLEMVNTLWDDDDWEKGGAEGGGDTDFLSGSLQRWPLLRPPVGFGGSHPPSSAASELSLTELEKRAKELDTDLEHLDLSQPLRDSQDVYPTLLEPPRERADMYQTHPGPQRDKAAHLSGLGSRSQVSLELNALASSTTDADKSSAETSTLGTSSTKEDSSPDSNLTLESDSSGVFLSLSNQSQEETGSDSDQPISGSDLGSSNTSLEKDGDDDGLKEWGREESAELQWCYPSLLNTSQQDVEGVGERNDEHLEGDENISRDDKIGKVSIIKTQKEHSVIRSSVTQKAVKSVETAPRKKVTLMGLDSPLLSKKHLLDPYQKPIRTSGLDCGDIDPFVQSDSFVYLAVSARSPSKGHAPPTAGQMSPHGTKLDTMLTGQERTEHVEQPNVEPDTKVAHLVPQKPEEGDFLCTDSFVYLAAPACLLLDPTGKTSYSGKESDSESSGSGPVDVSVLGCGSVVEDSDWDSDLSDSDPTRSSRCAGVGRQRRLPTDPDWDTSEDTPGPGEQSDPFTDEGTSHDAETVTMETTMETQASTSAEKPAIGEQHSTKKVTWQFKPAQRSVCTGSRKEKEVPPSSQSFTEVGARKTCRRSSSSSSQSSPSSSSSG
ncbi:uncharacterized protein LOC114456877 [Gouania willdenowi]|uniref:uncharacterized protein LOC114456877 n=1 Tax=Gouania willdenowi TaxID=441366 RepID=UPI001054E946|nr:uncharacterized protein LOC114456877 [Gouania willdenowi]